MTAPNFAQPFTTEQSGYKESQIRLKSQSGKLSKLTRQNRE